MRTKIKVFMGVFLFMLPILFIAMLILNKGKFSC